MKSFLKALRNVCQKDDIRDADYIARLFYVPGTKYVFVKNQRQQSLQFLQNEYKSLQELRILVGESDPHLSRRVRLFSTQGSSSKPPSLNDGGADLFKRVTFDQVLKSVESSRER